MKLALAILTAASGSALAYFANLHHWWGWVLLAFCCGLSFWGGHQLGEIRKAYRRRRNCS